MRAIKKRVWHCSATEAGRECSLDEIDSWHRARGFRCIGYHFLVHLDGSIDIGRPISEMGAHAQGHNRDSIGICYVGGIRNDQPADTRTPEQKRSMRLLRDDIDGLLGRKLKDVGHRDLSVDLNGDGIIQKSEWMKACPSFDVATEL